MAATLTVAAALGCAEPTAPPRPNVLLIVLDTFRADRMGAYGNPRGLTPFLDGLAAQGALFERAYSTSAWTPPAVASLLTSRYPMQHKVRDFRSMLLDTELTLAEALQPLGYRAAGFSANLYVREQAGFGQGMESLSLFVTMRKATKERADRLHDAALDWLDQERAAEDESPTFLYLQFMDVHSPFEPPEALRSRFAEAVDPPETAEINRLLYDTDNPERWTLLGERRADVGALYDAEVAGLDAALRRLFEALDARGFLDDAIVAIVADHGEEFGEHGRFLHGWQLYEESVHVPLLILAPSVAAGRRVPAPVSLVDVAPTILALLGESPPPSFEGQSLLPLLEDPSRTPERADVYLDVGREEGFLPMASHAAGLVRGTRKLLIDPSGGARLYDLERDPGEGAAAAPGAAEPELRAALERARTGWTETAAPTAGRTPVDEATRARLRALGYQTDEKDEAP